MAYSGQRKIAFDAGFQDALYGRPSDNPYTIGGSIQAYDDGYEQGLLSDIPPRGPKGDTGPQGPTGSPGINGISGTNGTNGTSALVGNGPPGAGLGNDGDTYTDADNGDIWLKTSGTWSLQGSPSLALITQLDSIDPLAVPEVIYKGEAVPGTATSAAAWRVSRITIQSDGDIAILFGNGTSNFTNIWDNRLSLSYS